MQTFWRWTFWTLLLGTLWLSLVPVDQVPPAILFWDKAQHALGFAALAVFGLNAYTRRVWLLTLGLVFFGAGIEFAQWLTGWREGDWLDWFADCIGLAIGGALWAFALNLLRKPHRLRKAMLPVIVFFLGVGVAAAAGWWRQYETDKLSSIVFDRVVQRIASDVRSRLDRTVDGLKSARAFYAVSGMVSRAQFHAYVESLNLVQEFPGVRGFGFVQRVPRTAVSAFVAAERLDGAPQFSIRQLNENGADDLFVVRFIAPTLNNAGAEGLDIGSELVRREYAQRAIDTGQPILSDPITLVQDQRRTPGVLMFLPVYGKGASPTSAGERRADLVGLLDAAIVFRELLDHVPDVIARRADFELITSALKAPEGTLLFDSDGHASRLKVGLAPPVGRRFSVIQPIELMGQTFTLRVNSTQEFDAAVDRTSPWLVFAAGVLGSTLLALLLHQQATGRRRAEEMALQMTSQLRMDQERSSDFSKCASDWFWETDAQNRYCHFSENFDQVHPLASGLLLGGRRDEMLTAQGLNCPESIKNHLAQIAGHLPFKNFEYMVIRADGAKAWIAESAIPHLDGNGVFAGYRGTGTLITERKQIEEDLRIAATAFDSQVGVVITDDRNVILRVNKSFTEITGYTSGEVVGKRPNLLSSGRHPPEFFQDMWASISQNGSWQGEIWNRRKSGEIFLEWLNISTVKDPLGRSTHFVGNFSDITSFKKAEEEIQNLAFFDPLTGLPNRRLLLDRLQHALSAGARHHRQSGLIFVDLDDFKTLNDTRGHASGDRLLIEVGKRLVSCVREGDTVARLGGDEFLVLLEDLSKSSPEAASQAERVCEKILDALRRPYRLDHVEHRSNASLGVALIDSDHRETTADSLRWADMAMYQAKAAGGNTYRFFEPQMQAVVTARAALDADLREALLKNQFLLHYQAQVNGIGQTIGAEVLLRWQHPQRGLVPPAEFIPLAEETGLILSVGQWVLEMACRQLALWADRAEMAHLTLAVNVSARQVQQADFVDVVSSTMLRHGIKRRQLKLELTESLLVVNVEDVIAKMAQLKDRGVDFSLDDFGTGYSSLSYLKRLPLDQLKIDQGFVRDILIDPNDAAIAKMVIVLADSLGLVVIAEGVETQAQREALAALGCHSYQGYLFSRPLALEQFEAFCRASCDLTAPV